MSTCCREWIKRKAILNKKLQFHFQFSSFQWTIDDTWLFGKNLFHPRPLMDRIVPKHEQHREQNRFSSVYSQLNVAGTIEKCSGKIVSCFIEFFRLISFFRPSNLISFCLYDDWSCTFLSLSFSSDKFTFTCILLSVIFLFFFLEKQQIVWNSIFMVDESKHIKSI